MTTKTYKGKTYEIGKIYEFSDDKKAWQLERLTDTDGSNYPFCTNRSDYTFCREVKPDKLGKITNPKVDPEVGKYYKASLGASQVVIQWNESLTMDSGLEMICEMVEKTEGEE